MHTIQLSSYIKINISSYNKFEMVNSLEFVMQFTSGFYNLCQLLLIKYNLENHTTVD